LSDCAGHERECERAISAAETAQEAQDRAVEASGEALQRHAEALQLAEQFIVHAPISQGQRATLEAIRNARISKPAVNQGECPTHSWMGRVKGPHAGSCPHCHPVDRDEADYQELRSRVIDGSASPQEALDFISFIEAAIPTPTVSVTPHSTAMEAALSRYQRDDSTPLPLPFQKGFERGWGARGKFDQTAIDFTRAEREQALQAMLTWARGEYPHGSEHPATVEYEDKIFHVLRRHDLWPPTKP
jgi:hypothetical protein